MASGEYTHGEMNIESQTNMWSAFTKASMWGSILLLISVGYMVFTLSVGLNWLASLIICAGAGIAIGIGMGFGGAWIATIIALSALALFVQLLVTLGSMLV